MHDRPAMLFDLDGTLVDSVYQHVLAWRHALFDQGFDLSAWRIHRRVGMSGGLLVHALGREVPVVTRDEVPFAKPDPDLFLAAAARVDAPIGSCIVVGDSVWDILAARRAGTLGVGVLSGGYSRQELEVAGAFRVYQDPAALEERLDELGIRR